MHITQLRSAVKNLIIVQVANMHYIFSYVLLPLVLVMGMPWNDEESTEARSDGMEIQIRRVT